MPKILLTAGVLKECRRWAAAFYALGSSADDFHTDASTGTGTGTETGVVVGINEQALTETGVVARKPPAKSPLLPSRWSSLCESHHYSSLDEEVADPGEVEGGSRVGGGGRSRSGEG
jgi:hypothetical protein